jgi:small multidrug resistance pump
MIGVFVTFRYGETLDEQAVRKIAEIARAQFEGMPGLRSKAFTLNSRKREATNFYVWESEDAARAFFNPSGIAVPFRVNDLLSVPSADPGRVEVVVERARPATRCVEFRAESRPGVIQCSYLEVDPASAHSLSQEVSQVHYYSFLAAAIVTEVVATMLLKLSDGLTKWWWAIASVFFYAIAGILLSFVLKYMAVGLVYAVWAGVGITLVCIASVVFLGQRFDAAALGGVALIIAGVLLITLKSEVTFQ